MTALGAKLSCILHHVFYWKAGWCFNYGGVGARLLNTLKTKDDRFVPKAVPAESSIVE